MRTLKQKLGWIDEFTNLGDFLESLDRRIEGYDAYYLNSTGGYRSPEAFEAEYLGCVTRLAEAC